MKKTLVAVAAMAAVSAFAQSSVQLVGTFDPSIVGQKTSYANGTSVSQQFIRNNSQGTSQITFKGVQDLGGGMKASFLLENDFDARFDANGNPLAGKVNLGSGGGEQYLALEGGFGKLALGSPNTPTLTTQASRNPFGTKIGSGFGAGGVLGNAHVRNNNSLVYTAPTFVPGLGIALGYASKTNPDVNAAAAYNISNGTTVASLNTVGVADVSDLGINYANGPLKAGVSLYSVSAVKASAAGATGTSSTPAATAAAGANEQTNFYAQYTLGDATVYAGYHTETTKSTTAGAAKTLNQQGQNVALKYAISPTLNLLANYGELNDKTAANGDKKITAVGAQYILSKTTSLYARYIEEANSNVNTAVVAASGSYRVKGVKTTLIGMQTNF